MKKYWTFERDGEVFDADFDSKEEAQIWAEEGFQQECEDEGGWNNGDIETAEIKVIQFYYDGETGERNIFESEKSTVEFEYYHGDAVEHGTLHSGGGGVL